MQLRGTVNFAAKQTAVWHSLTTPNIVSQCAPRLRNWKTLDANSQFQLQFAWGSDRNTILIPLHAAYLANRHAPQPVTVASRCKNGQHAAPIYRRISPNQSQSPSNHTHFYSQNVLSKQASATDDSVDNPPPHRHFF